MAVTDALSRYCIICRARPKQKCRNTIHPGAPLPGRDVHWARSTNLTATEKESEENDACY